MFKIKMSAEMVQAVNIIRTKGAVSSILKSLGRLCRQGNRDNTITNQVRAIGPVITKRILQMKG